MIRIEQVGGVALITFADASPLSRADTRFALALRDAARDAADSDDVKAIVLRSDRADFAPAPTAADLRIASAVREAERSKWHAAFCAPSGLYQNLAYCKKTVVTAVRGHCSAVGSMLVLCSDHTVCADDSRFEAPFTALPESSLVLAALTMRLNRAKSWMLGGDAWNADMALRAGLVNLAVAADGVDARARSAAECAARMPLDGVAMSKLLVEAFLDTQGVGQDFDMAGFHATALQAAERAAGAGA
ncbi:MAG TPA: enoyl-CoA hydratase/isomerase family protein [Ramlibacter sp.]|uniref:enoyl-CoA hydratase/isomerase family protein n=1 Tax=Ramlibacter sp. TaxID=1917967 RepID=UPI002C31B6E4|nr:enoyl-CoA hydratase/isomerase family protein [Ramlibacter sp.]HVZ42220.1 enoyl-CoA hydratase/isomerase family protein [Ramlibacter sp.]